MSKQKLFAAASLLSLTSLLCAGEDAQCRNLDIRISALESMQAGSGMVNPAVRPLITSSADVHIIGQILFMKAEQGGMEFATHMKNVRIGQPSVPSPGLPITNPASGPQTGTVISSQSEWDWGLRIGMGYNMIHDGWDVEALWTRFHTDHQKTNTRHNRDPGEYIPLVVPPMSGQNNENIGGLTTVGGSVTLPGFLIRTDWTTQRWRLNIDMADVELGREFFVSKWLTLRPFIGPRAAWINQQTRPQYYGGQFVSLFDGSASQATPQLINEPHSVLRITMSNRFWGVGPRIGMNTVWGMGGGFSLYGNADMAILWGRFRIRDQMYVTQENSRTTKIVDIHYHHQTRRPIANLTVGARYDHVFGEEGNYALGFFLGYEHNIFWDQNQEMKFDYANSFALGAVNDDLSLCGLHLGMIFDF